MRWYCPDCGAQFVVIEGVATCRRCGYSVAHPLAGRVWEIDNDLVRLQRERAQLIDQMRRDRSRAPPPGPMPPAPRAPAAALRSLPVPALLVGLGAFLVVVAGVVFAAVTWEQLGAAGQAAVLAVATATAVGMALVASRAGLTATAEALAVVAAGFGIIDVHAVRTAVAPEGDWQVAWAVGLVLLAVGLVAFGRAARLRAPAIVAVCAAQLPLVFLASLATSADLTIAAALVATSAFDFAVSRALSTDPSDWLPAPVPLVVPALATLTWVIGVIVTTPQAVGGESVSEVWWGVGVLVGATAVAGVEAWAGGPRGPRAAPAAAGAVLSGLIAVLAAAGAVIDDDYAPLLVSNASAAAVLAGFLVVRTRRVGVEGPEPEPDDAGTDPRVVAGQTVAGGWTAISLLPWLGPVLVSVAAPFALIGEEGWWTHDLSVTTGELDLQALEDGAGDGGPASGLVLTAVAIGTAAAVLAVRFVDRQTPEVRRWGTTAVIGLGLFAAVAVAGAFWDVAVVALVALYLVGAATLLLAPVPPGAPHRPQVLLGAVPVVGSAIAWAGTVDVLTVATLSALTVVGGAAVAQGLLQELRPWTVATTAFTGTTLWATALTLALAAGAGDQSAWIVALAVGTAGSGFAWIGDRWKPWWSPAVDVTSAATTGVALLGLAGAGGPDPFSVGLTIVVIGAAAHATRPSRRVIAATIAALAALVLLWLRLWEADIRLVEAYSLPAAVLAGGAGWWQLRRHPERGSWQTLGPGLLIAAIPSTLAAVAEAGVLRPLVVLTVAVVVTLGGARSRLRAPLAVGSVTAVIIAVDQVFPVVARLPRWVGIGTAGIVLLVVGATFERQRRRVAGLVERYRDLR